MQANRVAKLLLTLFLAGSVGCGPASSSDGTPGSTASPNDPLELTDDTIRERINDARVYDVPDESGVAEPISWGFDEDEPKEIVVVEKQIEGATATIVFDIKTMSSSRSRDPRYLAGQIRTKWELRTGWVLRKWEIVETENISMKYRKLPKPPPQNSDQGK